MSSSVLSGHAQCISGMGFSLVLYSYCNRYALKHGLQAGHAHDWWYLIHIWMIARAARISQQASNVSCSPTNLESRTDCLRSGAHHPERPSTLYLWFNLCPDWTISRHVFPANFCLHCSSYMTELNVEKNGDQSEVLHPSSVFLNHFCTFPRWFRPYADRSRDGRSRETILKIAQSGHRLSLRLSMGDGRSGWWAPAKVDNL